MVKNLTGKFPFLANIFKAKGVTGKDTDCLSVGVFFQSSQVYAEGVCSDFPL